MKYTDLKEKCYNIITEMTEIVTYSPVGSPLSEGPLSECHLSENIVKETSSSQLLNYEVLSDINVSTMTPLECFEYLNGLSESIELSPISNR